MGERGQTHRLLVLLALIGALLAGQAVLGSSAQAAGSSPVESAGTTTNSAAAVPLTAPVPASPLAPEEPEQPGEPGGPQGPDGPSNGDGGDVTVKFDDLTKKPSTPILVLLGLTLLSLVPAILLTCTSFTKILVVLGLTRNALGLQQIPPNQVLAGLALFLSLFVMAPVLGEINDVGRQPYLAGEKSQSEAWEDGVSPLREVRLAQAGD